jgi:hypothetical protein
MTEIASALRAELPSGYRALIGSSPPVADATRDEDISVQVERDDRLLAVIELISPRNKDRVGAREQYAARDCSPFGSILS